MGELLRRVSDWIRQPARPPTSAALRLLRVSLGIVYLWFGALKFVPGLSPAEALAVRTMDVLTRHQVPHDVSLPLLGLMESLIGAGLLTSRFLRPAVALMAVQMTGTFLPLALFPRETWELAPIAPSFAGQYILKNLVLASAALAVAATHSPTSFDGPDQEPPDGQAVAGPDTDGAQLARRRAHHGACWVLRHGRPGMCRIAGGLRPHARRSRTRRHGRREAAGSRRDQEGAGQGGRRSGRRARGPPRAAVRSAAAPARRPSDRGESRPWNRTRPQLSRKPPSLRTPAGTRATPAGPPRSASRRPQ
ncbi:DoxX family protein [Streptacidiphilus rugosus]|uniref:DoxX family protein n=1 Tax=Streptacidiphilus rugosus TaxID=405783 RepID=UPI00068EDDD4|nr:DoxX family protein [Streptacidiphilus rugosus]